MPAECQEQGSLGVLFRGLTPPAHPQGGGCSVFEGCLVDPVDRGCLCPVQTRPEPAGPLLRPVLAASQRRQVCPAAAAIQGCGVGCCHAASPPSHCLTAGIRRSLRWLVPPPRLSQPFEALARPLKLVQGCQWLQLLVTSQAVANCWVSTASERPWGDALTAETLQQC